MCVDQWIGIISTNRTFLTGRVVPMAKLVAFELRNGEQRLYKDVTRVDDTRPHLVLVYSNNVLIAQINKHDVVKYTWQEAPEAFAAPPVPLQDA
jgi:hypothetical protein